MFFVYSVLHHTSPSIIVFCQSNKLGELLIEGKTLYCPLFSLTWQSTTTKSR
eukprot:UN06270